MERQVYLSGHFVAESEALISFRDRGFTLGDAVFDAERTFNGQIFRLEAHIDRLYHSLSKTQIDPGLSRREMIDVTLETVERNRALLHPGEDYWVMQRVTRGLNVVGGDLWQSKGATVIIECTPLPLAARAPLMRDGLDIFVPSLRRTPPESLDPNIKSHNYLNLVMADNEVRSRSSHAWAVLLDTRGFLCEGIGSNVFIVRDRTLYTPRPDYVLPGISRQVVMDLAEKRGVEVVEADITPQEAKRADEVFITSTSFCICPVRTFEGADLTSAGVPGPITRLLSDDFSLEAGVDFRAQYLNAVETKVGE